MTLPPNGDMSRARRGRVEHLTRAADGAIEADRRFFERHRDRSYRVRLASAPEVEAARQLNSPEPPKGLRWFVAIRQVAPGIRLRAYFIGPGDNDTDISEAECRWLFEQVRPADRTVEKHLENLAAEHGLRDAAR